MRLWVERRRHDMSIEDDDLDPFAAIAGVVDRKARLDLGAIGRVSAEGLEPMGFVDTAPRARRIDRLSGAANLQCEFASCTAAKVEVRRYRSIGVVVGIVSSQNWGISGRSVPASGECLAVIAFAGRLIASVASRAAGSSNDLARSFVPSSMLSLMGGGQRGQNGSRVVNARSGRGEPARNSRRTGRPTQHPGNPAPWLQGGTTVAPVSRHASPAERAMVHGCPLSVAHLAVHLLRRRNSITVMQRLARQALCPAACV